jgi:hypothetical protein
MGIVMAKQVTQQQLYKLLAGVSLLIAIAFVGIAGFAYWGYSFSSSTVHNQLAQEKIKFPASGTPALDPEEYPGLQKYAGQQVDTGKKAKAYADEFIWVHMMKASGGKTYAEVSEAAMANKSDTKLAALKNTLFQGDMLRSSLLTAYAFSVFGTIAGYATVASLALGLVFAIVAMAVFTKSRASV